MTSKNASRKILKQYQIYFNFISRNFWVRWKWMEMVYCTQGWQAVHFTVHVCSPVHCCLTNRCTCTETSIYARNITHISPLHTHADNFIDNCALCAESAHWFTQSTKKGKIKLRQRQPQQQRICNININAAFVSVAALIHSPSRCFFFFSSFVWLASRFTFNRFCDCRWRIVLMPCFSYFFYSIALYSRAFLVTLAPTSHTQFVYYAK